MYKEKIVNITTNEEIWRDYTPEEIEEVEKAQAEFQKFKAEQEAKAVQRASILERLGLTEEEAKLLLS